MTTTTPEPSKCTCPAEYVTPQMRTQTGQHLSGCPTMLPEPEAAVEADYDAHTLKWHLHQIAERARIHRARKDLGL